MLIDRSKNWKPKSLSTNFLVDPVFGANTVYFLPEFFAVFRRNDKQKKYRLIFSTDDSFSNPNIKEFNYSIDIQNNEYFELPEAISNKEETIVKSNSGIIREILIQGYNSNTSENSLNSIDVDSSRSFLINELDKTSENWERLNLVKNAHFLVRVARWIPTRDVTYDNIVVDKFSTFSLVLDGLDSRFNFLFKYENKEFKEVLFTGPVINVNKEDSILTVDRNWNSWSVKIKDVINSSIEKYNLEDSFNETLEEDFNIDNNFNFRVLNEDLPVVPYGKYGESQNKFYSYLNLSYSDSMPIIEIEDVSPSFENHDLEFELGEPSLGEHGKFISVKISYRNDFTKKEGITENFGNGKKYNVFDNTSFFTIKATCRNESKTLEQSCFATFKSDFKEGKLISLKICHNLDVKANPNPGLGFFKIYNYVEDTMVSLPLIDENESTIVGYTTSLLDPIKLEYREKILLSEEETRLYGWSWAKIFNNNINLIEENLGDLQVSSLPYLTSNGLTYFSSDNRKIKKLVPDTVFKLQEISSISNNYYSIVKVEEINENNIFLDKSNEKLILFSFDSENNNIISLSNYNLSNEKELKLIGNFRNCFFIPFGNAKVSKIDNNTIKLLCLATFSNDFIEKDESLYLSRKYNSSIGNICSIYINIKDLTYTIKELYTASSIDKLSQSGTKEKEGIYYYPLVLRPEFIRNGEKNYSLTSIDQSFVRRLGLIEFDLERNVDLWIVPSKEVKISLTNNSISKEVSGNSKILLLTNVNSNNLIENETFFDIKDNDSISFVDYTYNNEKLAKVYINNNKVTYSSESLKFKNVINNEGNNYFIFISNYPESNRVLEYIDTDLEDSKKRKSHIVLSGITRQNSTSERDRDDVIISGYQIYPISDSLDVFSIKPEEIANKIITYKIINGHLFGLSNDFKVYNLGGYFSKYEKD